MASLVDEMLSYLNPAVPMSDSDPESKVAKYYANRSIFITGATGFLGKAMIEKLIRSCKDVKKIYLLIREKRGKSIQERLADLIQSQSFDKIRENNNGSNEILEDKLYAIKGDITLPNFGVSPEDIRLLASECTIIFNSAATIRFVEQIEIAVRNNIYSVGQLIDFCDQLTNLEAIVHLSTAYSNCHKRDTIYEIFYEPPMGGDEVLSAIEKLKDIQNQIHICPIKTESNSDEDDEDVGPLSRSACKLQTFYHDTAEFVPTLAPSTLSTPSSSTLIKPPNGCLDKSNVTTESGAASKANVIYPAGFDLLEEFSRIALRRSNRPNTYTFTKAISENYLLEKVRARPDRYLRDGKIPVAIIRPSIVGCAWREPTIGLVDNFNGPTGAILSLYTGALQAMPGRSDRVADLVPVDMVTNMTLCAGWFLGTKVESSSLDASACSGQHQLGSSNLHNNSIVSNIKQDQGVYIFNMVSGFRNPLRWGLFTEKITDLAYKFPSKFLTRLPTCFFIEAGCKYELYDKINHKLPAYLMDFVRVKVLRQPVDNRSSARVAYSRIKQMTDTLTPFTSNQWRLSDSNVRILHEQLNDADKKLFHFDVKSIKWPDYIRNYIIGSRIYTLRDSASNVPEAIGLLKRRQILYRATITMIITLIYYFALHGI